MLAGETFTAKIARVAGALEPKTRTMAVELDVNNAGRVLALPSQSVALLAALLLRGPQTVSELRANSERLHRFADLSAVEGFLDELAARRWDGHGFVPMPPQEYEKIKGRWLARTAA